MISLDAVGRILALCVVLPLFMAGFDLAIGMLVLRRSWSKALTDFDPATGHLLVVGLALLVVFPALVASIRGLT